MRFLGNVFRIITSCSENLNLDILLECSSGNRHIEVVITKYRELDRFKILKLMARKVNKSNQMLKVKQVMG